MIELLRIQKHLAAHGIACALMADHVAISVRSFAKTADGALLQEEEIKRATTLEEAQEIIDCISVEGSSKPCFYKR